MRYIIIVLLACFIATIFAGCSEEGYRTDTLEDMGFVKIKTLGSSSTTYLVYDKETYVQYIIDFGYSGTLAISPYYDETGNVAIYNDAK